MNYNIRTFCSSVSLEKRARVDSCQRAIIVFECNNFTKNKNNSLQQRHEDKYYYTTQCVRNVYILHYR